MKVKRLAGTFGIGAVYDGFTRALILSFFTVCYKLQWPTVGACKFCGHGPKAHTARRDRGLITWKCYAEGTPCECEHYDPERAIVWPVESALQTARITVTMAGLLALIFLMAFYSVMLESLK